MEVEATIIGLGSGRCGTQTFANMFDLPHEEYEWDGTLRDDVAPYYLDNIEEIDKAGNVLFVCLKRDKAETVDSFVKNKVMGQEEASEYYDTYYDTACKLAKKMKNFRIFYTEELDHPERIERFLGRKSHKVAPVTKLCKFCNTYGK